MKEISDFGKLQRKIRNESKMSVRELAEKSGVSQSYLSQVENGTRSTPSMEIIKKIADALEYDYYEMAILSGAKTEKDIYLDSLTEQAEHVASELNFNLTLMNNLEEIIDSMPKNKSIPEELLKSKKELESVIILYQKKMEELNEQIFHASEGEVNDEELVVFDDKAHLPTQYVSFSVPQFEMWRKKEE